MTLGPYELDTIVCGDCLQVMGQMPDGCVDLIVTDPPYGIGYASNMDKQWCGKKRKADSSFGSDRLDMRCCPALARVLKEGGAAYVFTRWDVARIWADALTDAGLTVVQRIVWDKVTFGMGDLRYFGSQTEDILFCRKGQHHLRWAKRQGNIWRFWKAAMWNEHGHSGHPTEKPAGIMRRAIELSSSPSDLVFDPFLGSGTTAVAAKKLGRHYFGCDISPHYVELANKRLAKVDGIQLPLLPR